MQSFCLAFVISPAPYGHKRTVALHVLLHMFEFKSYSTRVGIIFIPMLIRATEDKFAHQSSEESARIFKICDALISAIRTCFWLTLLNLTVTIATDRGIAIRLRAWFAICKQVVADRARKHFLDCSCDRIFCTTTRDTSLSLILSTLTKLNRVVTFLIQLWPHQNQF